MYAQITLPVLIDYVNEKGFLINNLFQLSNGRWQANLRSKNPYQGGEFFHEFGHGATHKDALMAALEKAI